MLPSLRSLSPCPAADVGATIELGCGGAKVSGKITAAHDPPARGGEHDRVERAESYVKDFEPLALGTIDLEKGRGTLTLRAHSLSQRGRGPHT